METLSEKRSRAGKSRRTYEKTCEWCGVPFTGVWNARFCGWDCRQKSHRAMKKRKKGLA